MHSGAPPSLWAEAVCMVTFVWNNLAVCPDPADHGAFLSRTAILEGRSASAIWNFFEHLVQSVFGC